MGQAAGLSNELKDKVTKGQKSETVNYGRYQILKEVGRGSMGVVYQAHDPQIDRLVALKVLRRDRITGESFVKRFLKEARVIGRLSHSNIVTIYDIGQDREDIYIAMEFIEGAPLNEFVRESGLPLEKIIELGIQAAETLDYAHQKGVVHRDVKPSNIILQPNGKIKITDFGIAHFEDSSETLQTLEGEIMGTPAYMSPEQVMGKSVDGRTDIFSLGTVLYELITGRRPFGGEGKGIATVFNEIIHQEPQEPALASDLIPQELSMVIMKCLRKTIDERFQTGKELAEALRVCLLKRGPAVVEKTSNEKKKQNYSIPFVAAIAGSVLAFGIYYFFQHTNSPLQKPSSNQENLPLSKAAPSTFTSETKQAAPVSPAGPANTETQKPENKRSNSEEKSFPSSAPPAEQSRRIEVKKQTPVTNKSDAALKLTPLTLITTPKGASVYIDEKFKGTTPLTLMLSKGKHQIRMALSGYQDVDKQITLEETMEYPLAFNLEAVKQK
jgi:eukaryotic-like serine/threonine-protein kinase